MKAVRKLQENEIIHIISHMLIRENPTVKRQEMKPGNKFQGRSLCFNLHIISVYDMHTGICVTSAYSIRCSDIRNLVQLIYNLTMLCKNRKRRFVLQVHFFSDKASSSGRCSYSRCRVYPTGLLH